MDQKTSGGSTRSTRFDRNVPSGSVFLSRLAPEIMKKIGTHARDSDS
nr:hypothetical protein [Burkholderia stabilis]